MNDTLFAAVWDVADRKPDPAEALAFVTTIANGAEVLFTGTVRNVHQGRSVAAISYDAFDPLAVQTFQTICDEARARWGDDLRLYIVHGKGRVNVGEISIVIAVGSPHRDAAFMACRYIIDEIKQRSPVWKLEHYADGDSEWVQGCVVRNGPGDHDAAS